MRRRYVAQVISESTNQGAGSRPFYSWLESCLRHKGEMVIMEAARAIVNMPEVTQRELQPAVTVLQLFLTSSKPTLRFAAVRTLNKVRASAQLRNEGRLRHVTPSRGCACAAWPGRCGAPLMGCIQCHICSRKPWPVKQGKI